MLLIHQSVSLALKLNILSQIGQTDIGFKGVVHIGDSEEVGVHVPPKENGCNLALTHSRKH